MYSNLVAILGREMLFEGRIYPYYLVNYSEYKLEKPFYYNYIIVGDKNSTREYKVVIKNNGEEIYDYACDCQKFKANKMCEHVAAALFHCYHEIIENEYVDELIIGNRLLNFFSKNDVGTVNKIKKKINLEVEIIFDTTPISFRLLVGEDKLYVVTPSKLTEFLTSIECHETMNFGKKFTFDASIHYFDEKAKKILAFVKGYQDNYYYYRSNNPYVLSKRELLSLLEILDNKDIHIKDHGMALNVYYGMPTSYTLSKDEHYSLEIDDFSNYHILSRDCEYILYNQNLYILSEEEKRIIDALQNYSLNKLEFASSDIELFQKGLFNDIKKNIKIDENIHEIKLPTKPETNLYFDISNILKCRVEFDYNGEIINYFDKMTPSRSQEDEMEIVNDLVSNHFEARDKYFILEDSDTIYDFIENNLESLNNKYHVFLDKKLQETKFLKKLNIQNNFSIGQDNILSYKFSISEIKNDELDGVLKALRLKKKYYRLKNNQIVNLLDSDLSEVNSLMEDLNLSKNDIENGEVVIPKYRAIYVDSIKNKYHNIETNNLFDNFIDNFKKYQNVDLKLDKDDLKILRDYQKEGVKWLYTIYKCDLGGILADEMGLGKTLQTITLIKHLLKEKVDAKILIVSPTSLVYNWKKEFDKFAPHLKYITVSENKSNRLKIFEQKDNYNIFITSYGLISHDNDEYEKMNFELCIIDEGQKIKNYKSTMTQEIKKIKANCKIALTGTPIENNLTELWSIFDFIMPGYLNNVTNFHSKYNITDTDEENKKLLLNLKEQIKPFILRRKKNDVLSSLPDKMENNLYVELPDKQKILYAKEVKETKEKIDELVSSSGFMKSKIEIFTLLTKLRQICIDPSVMYENYHDGSIKLDTLLDIVKENILNGHKMLIFSSFKRVLDNVKKMLSQNDIASYMIDGTVKSLDRIRMVDAFNSDDTPCFLITLKAGGTGLNLVGADTVIHLDIWWNPQVENQATDRAHRIGQTKNVNVLKIICKDTIEEHIIELQEKKKFLSDNLIEDNNNVSIVNNLTEKDIKKLLSFSNEE